MKQYFEHIAWYDYLIFLVYGGIFSYLLFRIGDVFFNIGKKTLRVLLLIFLFYFLLINADSLFDFLPYLPDSDMYSFMISSGQYPDTSSENILVLYYLTLFIGTICLNNPIIYIFFSVFLYIISLMIFIKAWKGANPDFSTNDELIFALFAFVWPAGMIYLTVPLREAFILFAFAMFFSGFLNFILNKKWKLLIIGSILICAIRLQMIVFVFPVLGALAVWKLNIKNYFKLIIGVATIVIAFLAVRYILVEKPLSPETMAELRNVNISNAGPLGYGNVEWHSYVDMMRDYPFIIAQFLFSPMPIFVQHDPLSTFIPFLDFLFMMILLIIILLRFKHHWKDHRPVILFLLFYIILFGGYEYHITGAVRHRMPMEIIMMLMASSFISKKIFKGAG
ncbi:MAG: hypothetical protein ACHQFW_06715 [Chitinophagales bacterium]